MRAHGQEQGRAGSGPGTRSASERRNSVPLSPDWLRHLQRVASGGRAASAGAPSATATVQRAEEEGNASSAPAPAAETAPQPVNLDSLLGTERPAYWDSLNWREEKPGSFTADLPADHEVFRKIEEYAQSSQARAPYKSQAGEATRMDVVKNELNDPAKRAALGDAGVRKLEARLREGKKGGPNPPKSRPMRIERITVVANPALWKVYAEEKKIVQGSMVTKTEGGFAPAKDPSDKIIWSTGSRPDLGGAADMKRPEPVVNPMPGGDARKIMPPEATAEAFFFHGASPAAIDGIQQSGFDPERVRNRGTDEKPRYGVLGRGFYMADNSSKAQTYIRCAEPTCTDYDCTDPSHPPKQTLLARGMVGYPTRHHVYDSSKRGDDFKDIKDGRSSVVSQGLSVSAPSMGATGGNEFLFKNKSHLYPEFRVYYRD